MAAVCPQTEAEKTGALQAAAVLAAITAVFFLA
jgi:hypothetical protein